MTRTTGRTGIARFTSALAALVLGGTAGLTVSASAAHAAPGAQFSNPAVNTPNSADPAIVFANGNYHYLATTWTNQLLMRVSPTIAGLKTAPERLIYTSAGNTLWAPDIQFINNRWYIYYSVEQAGAPRRTHVLESAGTNAAGPYTHRGILNLMPNNGWAIDFSVLRLNNALYGIFSAFHSDGLQSNWIAPMSNPYTASGFGTRISAPTLAWERQGGAVNEGPVALQRNGRTWITYSASHCNGPDYKIGQLEYNGGNPLLQSSWVKRSTPIFQRNDAAGVYGPAHHTFFTSPDGSETWIAYHANSSPTQGCGTTRTTRMQRISWNADGTPNLGVPVALGTILAGPSGENLAAAPVNYRINNVHSGKAMDIQMPNLEDRARIGQYTYSGGWWQQFQFQDAGGGYFRIASRHSGRCLDVLDFSAADGAQLVQYQCLNGTNQQFQMVAVAGGFQLRARHSGKCIEVAGLSTANGTGLQQWTCNTHNVQKWTRTTV